MGLICEISLLYLTQSSCEKSPLFCRTGSTRFSATTVTRDLAVGGPAEETKSRGRGGGQVQGPANRRRGAAGGRRGGRAELPAGSLVDPSLLTLTQRAASAHTSPPTWSSTHDLVGGSCVNGASTCSCSRSPHKVPSGHRARPADASHGHRLRPPCALRSRRHPRRICSCQERSGTGEVVVH